METEQIKQYADNNITVIYAEAEANATKIRELALSEAFQIEVEGYGEAFKRLDGSINFSDDKAFLMFMFAEIISKFNDKTNLSLGFSN